MFEGKGTEAGDGSGGGHQHRHKRQALTLRAATREDLDQFEHYRPTVEATVAELDGRLIAVGGFAFLQGMVFLFLELRPEARRFKVTMHKTARGLMVKAKLRGFRFVYANTDGTEPTAPRWLARLGFEEIGIGLYRWQHFPQS